MIHSDVVASLTLKYRAVFRYLSEKGMRAWAASEAKILGYGGISAVSKATGLSRTTIHVGLAELELEDIGILNRRPGGGRKPIIEKQPMLLKELEGLLDPVTRGDPESPLKWTCKSTENLSKELKERGYKISPRSVANLLIELGYSLQSNNKRYEGSNHPDRNKQFNYIYNKVKKFQKTNNPIISVDAKKKELIGNYKNNGRTWRPKGKGEEVNVYDFPDPKKPKATPYGVYDITANEGWVSIGISHDTAEFAVATIKRWWKKMGIKKYPKAKKLFITADSGGSNSSRTKLWKAELQNFADYSSLDIHVSHFPPGTSKWNNIEDRMFNFISINWKGQPLKDLGIIVNLISGTKTKEGLEIRAELDKKKYEKGIDITDEEMEALKIIVDKFHGEWNYILKSRAKKQK